jgi:hypothetical protein
MIQLKKTGRALALTTALVAAASLSAVPSAAYARGWHGSGHWHGGGRWAGPAVGLGILGGALAGAAIASSPYYYGYGYPYYSYPPYYGYYGYY